jgi:hypothetical protein
MMGGDVTVASELGKGRTQFLQRDCRAAHLPNAEFRLAAMTRR